MHASLPRFACLTLLTLLLVLTRPASAGSLAVQTANLPDVPAPPQGSMQWIAPSMRMNGLPMTLKSFESRLSPSDLFNHYESIAHRWGRGEFRRSTHGNADVLSIRAGRSLITVEATATARGSLGTITVSGSPEFTGVRSESRFPRPESARLVNWQEYEDDGVESEHISLVSMRSIAVETAGFNVALTRDGWQILRQQPMQARTRGMVIEAQRGAQLALLTLQQDRTQPAATAIVIVWRKS